MQSVSVLLGASLLLAAGASFGEPQSAPQANPQAPPQTKAQAAPQGTSGSTMGADKPKFKQEELDQILAPVALHPDNLLVQILMAATYPIEIVQADRWVKANPKLQGDALAKELEKQSWDASVKSLVNCPQVLTMMSEKLDWTVNLGNAFLGQQKEVMDTVQNLRKKAKDAGNLESGKEQKVTTKEEEGKEVIVIETSDPEVIYVPTYNPTVIYGPWWYPAYPPYYWYPPAYVPPPYPAFHFSMGFAFGVAWGYAWGGCNWGHNECDIDINRNVERNRNIDRSKQINQLDKGGLKNGKGNWKHDPSHRQGVSYRDQATAKQFGGASASDTARARDSYRGRTPSDTGATSLDRSGGRPSDRAGATDRSASDRAGTSDRSGRGNGFDGVRDGGGNARAASDRGRSSRSSSPSPAARPRGGGGSRGGGRGGRRG
jgi:hypothetical protein